MKKRLFFLLLVMVCIVSIYLYFEDFKGNNFYINDQDVEVEVIDEQEEIKEENYSVSMIMVGDNLIHSSVYKDAYNGSTYDFTKMYEFIKPIVTNYDIAYYNQETILV